MTGVFFVIPLLFVFALARVRVRIAARVVGAHCKATVSFQFFWRLVNLETSARIDMSADSGPYFVVTRDWGLCRIAQRGVRDFERRPEMFDTIERWMRIDGIMLRADVGCADNALLTAMLAGMATELCGGLAGFAASRFTTRCTHVDIRPVFVRDAFRLDLECIITVLAEKLIIEMILILIRRVYKKCRIRLKT